MVQKLPSTLYKKVVNEHHLHCLRTKQPFPENKIELHQQIAVSPELNKYIDTCKLLVIMHPC